MIETRVKLTDEFTRELVSRLDKAISDADADVITTRSLTAVIIDGDLDDLSNIFSDVVKTLVDEVNEKVLS